MSLSIGLSIIGFVSVLVGLTLEFGIGWACLVGGAILFVAGGLGSVREGR